MKVLIIEDDDLLRGQMARRFRQAGFEVREATDGELGVRAAHRWEPDVVVTDLLMPNKEGLETIRELRASRPDLPVVAVSGGMHGMVDYLKIAKMLGAKACFHKPFKFPELIEAVRRVVDAA